MDAMGFAAAVLAAFFAGWTAGGEVTARKDFRLVMSLVSLEPKENGVLQPTAKEPEESGKDDADGDIDAMLRAEEDARLQKLLENVDNFGTDVPQHEIEPRRDI